MKRILPAAIFCLSACAPARMIPLSPEKQASIVSSQVLVERKEEKIQFQINGSNAGASFGLLGALIDAGVQSAQKSKAENRGAEIREALKAYDYEEEAKKKFEAGAAGVAWLKARSVEMEDTKEIESLISQDAGMVAKLSLSPSMTPNFSQLQLVTVFELHADDGSKKPIYRVTFNDVLDELTPAGKANENAETWSEEGAKRLLGSLKAGVSAAVDKVLSAMQQPGAAQKE